MTTPCEKAVYVPLMNLEKGSTDSERKSSFEEILKVVSCDVEQEDSFEV